MPLPPAEWTQREIDEHWYVAHMAIGEEALALKQARNPHLRLAAVAQRIVQHFGEIVWYDIEVMMEGVAFSILEHDLVPLTDGVWLPGVKPMPPEIKTRQIFPRTGKQAVAQRKKVWNKLVPQLLENPWNVIEPSERKKHRRHVKGWLTLRFQIMQRDNYRCRLCGVAARDGDHIRLEVDHITPRSEGGADTPENLWLLCFDCNRGKGTKIL